MSVLDLLLADALASGLARALAEDRPPPDNFFVIPPVLEAWLKIKASCNRENMVICVEVTEDSHAGCRQVQPLFMELARKTQQIPFFRVKIGLGSTHNKLREDLGGIEKVPTIVVVFFDDDTLRISQVEGAVEATAAIKSGALESVIKQNLERKARLKMTERLAGALLLGAVGQAAARRRQEEVERREKEQRQAGAMVALLAGLGINDTSDGDSDGGKTTCDLCDGAFPNPVTYHMRKFHTGCGRHANGMGYNSRGQYVSGWKGDCGDGGRSGSTWYLLCRDCRAKYLRQK